MPRRATALLPWTAAVRTFSSITARSSRADSGRSTRANAWSSKPPRDRRVRRPTRSTPSDNSQRNVKPPVNNPGASSFDRCARGPRSSRRLTPMPELITESDLAQLIAQVKEAADALIAGHIDRYLVLIHHAEDYTLLNPAGGTARQGFDDSAESRSAMARMFKSGSADLELI